MSLPPDPHPDHPHHAELDWDEDGQPLSRAFGDVYFSRANGLAETRHVFLQHNHLAERFAQLTPTSVFTIGETGFGSGLNFLAAWQLWLETAPAGARLQFITTEKYPLSRADLLRALALWPELGALTQALLAQYPHLVNPGFHRLHVSHDVSLTLIIDDAAAGLEQLLLAPHMHALAPHGPLVDAWFLDGFAPAKNPQMWSAELFAAIGKLSRPGSTAATFSAAGIVKQGLRGAGFEIVKVPGFGRKREMVRAERSDPARFETPVDQACAITNQLTPDELQAAATLTGTGTITRTASGITPWMLVRDQPTYPARTATIIGGGLAGCHSARALALRGWRVTLIERTSQLATAGSGNPQGTLYAKLSFKQEPLAAFNLASLQFALRTYTEFWRNHPDAGQACGVLQLAHTAAEQQIHDRLQEALASSPQDLVRFVDAAEASTLAKVSIDKGGLFFPHAGWLNPPAVCAWLVDHPNIRVVYNTTALALSPRSDGSEWDIIDTDGSVTRSAIVVIANARDAQQFAQSAHLPLKHIRGQVSYLPASALSQQLATVVCGDGYIAPAMAAADQTLMHCVGATFNLHDEESAPRASDHATNLLKIQTQLPALGDQWQHLNPEKLPGRVGFRCTTQDYLPVIGPAPKAEEFIEDYAALRKNAQAVIPQAGRYWPGLYLNVGHGSRGLAYTPLAAELLACHVTGEAFPVARELVQALHPARFLIRGLQRNRL
jgi:tRNA 5-methylaminomethyl-2-thiouridine biosynthesis bifunctional protein